MLEGLTNRAQTHETIKPPEQLRAEAVADILSLELPYEHYVVVGGAAMKLHGIKDTPDTDILVSEWLYDHCRSKQTWVDKTGFRKPPGLRSMIEEYSPEYGEYHLRSGTSYLYASITDNKYRAAGDELIPEAVNIENVPVAPLERIIKWKQAVARRKDLRDIERIENWLQKEQHGY